MRINPNYRHKNTGDRNYNAELYQFCLDFQTRRHENGELDVVDKNLKSLSWKIAYLQYRLEVYERKRSQYPKIEKPQRQQIEATEAQKWRESLSELASIKDRLEEKLGEQFLSSSDKRLEFNPMLLLMDILENDDAMSTVTTKVAHITRCFYDEKLPQILSFEYARPVLEKIIGKIDPKSLQDFFRIYAAPAISEALEEGNVNSRSLNMANLALQNFARLLGNCDPKMPNFYEARTALDKTLNLISSTITNLRQPQRGWRDAQEMSGVNDALRVLDAAIGAGSAASSDPQLLQMRKLPGSANSSAPQTRAASPSANAANGARTADYGASTDL